MPMLDPVAAKKIPDCSMDALLLVSISNVDQQDS